MSKEKANTNAVINKELMVEGFNPDDYKQYYDDGTPYLPFKVQLAWFRLKYPNGKLPVFRPEWSESKDANTYVATARVYRNASDAQDAYISEASAKRGPGVKIVDTGEDIDPYNAVQIAAMSLALKLAGFWCSLTEADLTKELERANQPEENSDASTTEAAVTGKKRGRRKKTDEAATPADMPATVSDINNEDKVETGTENAGEDEAPVTEAPVEAEKEESAEPEKEEVSESTTEEPIAVEETVQPEAEVQSSEEDVSMKTDTEPKAEKEDAAASETSEEPAGETEVSETTSNEEAKTETVLTESAEEPAKQASVAVDDSAAEELRAVPFVNGYYNGTIGDLEQKRIENKELETNLYNWLLNAPAAKRKNEHAATAARIIAETFHPDWLQSENKN